MFKFHDELTPKQFKMVLQITISICRATIIYSYKTTAYVLTKEFSIGYLSQKGDK